MYGYIYLIYDLNGWLAVVGSCMIVSMKMMIGGSIWCFDVLIDMSKRESKACIAKTTTNDCILVQYHVESVTTST